MGIWYMCGESGDESHVLHDSNAAFGDKGLLLEENGEDVIRFLEIGETTVE
jgi:hypothetical protein